MQGESAAARAGANGLLRADERRTRSRIGRSVATDGMRARYPNAVYEPPSRGVIRAKCRQHTA